MTLHRPAIFIYAIHRGWMARPAPHATSYLAIMQLISVAIFCHDVANFGTNLSACQVIVLAPVFLCVGPMPGSPTTQCMMGMRVICILTHVIVPQPKPDPHSALTIGFEHLPQGSEKDEPIARANSLPVIAAKYVSFSFQDYLEVAKACKDFVNSEGRQTTFVFHTLTDNYESTWEPSWLGL